jgi:hypothetical protein
VNYDALIIVNTALTIKITNLVFCGLVGVTNVSGGTRLISRSGAQDAEKVNPSLFVSGSPHGEFRNPGNDGNSTADSGIVSCLPR